MLSTSMLTILIAATSLRVVVVPISGAEDKSGVDEVVRVVGGVVDEYYGLRATTIDDLFSADGSQLSGAIRRCGTDNNCVRRAISDYGADLGIVVALNRRSVPALVELEYLDVRSGAAKRFSQIADLPNPSEEATAIRAKTETLLARAGHERAAQISVRVEPADATVVIDKRPPEIQTTNIFSVRPGTHVLDLSRDGYKAQSFNRDLEPGDLWNVEAQLEPDSMILDSPWFWGAVGLVAVAATVTTVALVRDNDGICLKDSEATPSDPCY